jgi:opacity protein-like surface antigen
MKKMLLTTAALAVVIASPAFAHAAARKHAAPIYGQTVPYGAWSAHARSRGTGLGGDYVGTDPDPNVRLELRKNAQEGSSS